MKFLLVLLLLVGGGVGYLLFSPSGGKGEPAKEPSATAEPNLKQPAGSGASSVTIVNKEASQTDQSSQSTGRPLVGGEGFISDAAAVGGYAMGHTQVMVKNRVSEKLKKKNAEHNKKLNDLMK